MWNGFFFLFCFFLLWHVKMWKNNNGLFDRLTVCDCNGLIYIGICQERKWIYRCKHCRFKIAKMAFVRGLWQKKCTKHVHLMHFGEKQLQTLLCLQKNLLFQQDYITFYQRDNTVLILQTKIQFRFFFFFSI